MLGLIIAAWAASPLALRLLSPVAALVLYYALVASAAALIAMVLVPVKAAAAFGAGAVPRALFAPVRWYAWFWIGLIAELAAVVLTPFVALFADHDSGRLPASFQWMETWDAALPGFPASQGFTDPAPASWCAWWWQSCRWLWRNRIYRFSTMTMGAATGAQLWAWFGALDTNLGDADVSRWFIGLYRGPSGRIDWEIAYAHRVIPGKVLDFRAGYKLRAAWGKAAQAQHVVRLRPFTSE